jgi:transcriptional regulator with XRE-family HTH domain
VSLPYLNQMENNNRPVSTTVVLALAQEFGFDVTELGTGDAERLVSDMREALADPVFGDDRAAAHRPAP